MIELIRQFVQLPMNVFAFGLDLMRRSIGGFQGIADLGVQAAEGASRSLATPVEAAGAALSDGIRRAQAPTAWKEDRMNGRDQDLSGDDLKLVRYTILYIQRDREAFLERGEELVAGNLDGNTFASYLIDRWRAGFQRQGIEPPPAKWGGGFRPDFAREDWKYLRVYFEVLQRFPREEKEYDRTQVDALNRIAHALGG